MNLSHLLELPWVVPVVCGSIVAVVAILGGIISDCFKTVARTDLKRSMVERGYTIEQIDHVLTGRRT
jgi:hypothetical protein